MRRLPKIRHSYAQCDFPANPKFENELLCVWNITQIYRVVESTRFLMLAAIIILNAGLEYGTYCSFLPCISVPEVAI
jgi:hypothetical protein